MTAASPSARAAFGDRFCQGLWRTFETSDSRRRALHHVPCATRITVRESNVSINEWMECYPVWWQTTVNVTRNINPLHSRFKSHFTVDVREHLNRRFGQRWTDPNGPISWPLRSVYLTPLNVFQRGRKKSLIYLTPVETEENLLVRVVDATQQVDDAPGVIERLYQNIIRRYQLCHDDGGCHNKPEYQWITLKKT